MRKLPCRREYALERGNKKDVDKEYAGYDVYTGGVPKRAETGRWKGNPGSTGSIGSTGGTKSTKEKVVRHREYRLQGEGNERGQERSTGEACQRV